jgi:hypothetical protein
MLLETRPFLPIWWLAAVQCLGLTCAWLARVHQGSRRQSSWQWLFLLLFALVGVTTLSAAMTSPAWCLVCGTTLAVMLLAAVWDFDKGKTALARQWP